MKGNVLLRSFLIGTAGCLVLAAQATGQSPESSWSTSLITLLAPILLLIVIWFLVWKRIGFGKGGYRKRWRRPGVDRNGQRERAGGENRVETSRP